jgi:epoxyqueuosine reductase
MNPERQLSDSELLDEVRRVATSAGIDAVGVTTADRFDEAQRAIEERKARGLNAGMVFTYGKPERAADPQRIMPGARSIVVGLRSYGTEDPEPPSAPSARIARYVRRDEYGALAEGLEKVAQLLRDHGAHAEVVLDQNRLIDRAAAYRAGLGWLGHNTNLLHPELGSWVVIGSVVTTAELPTAQRPIEDGCGSCRKCQQECPTGALDEQGTLDANLCLAWLVQADGSFPAQHRVALGDRLYGCDDCQEVCPVNPRLAQPDVGGANVQLIGRLQSRASTVAVLDLLAATDDDLMAEFGHWYVPRRRPEYLRRNALVVLGNSADSSPAVGSTLRLMLCHHSDVVRAHAVWAAKRLGFDDLLTLVANDESANVQEELSMAVTRRTGALS